VDEILVSVIVPVYNVEMELDRCVQSILAQTYKKLEIILVDDGSPDNCPVICDEYAKSDSRVRVIHKKNGGLSDARNAGLRIATGEYVMYVDSDDYIELDSCERLLAGADEDVDFVVGACREVRSNRISYQKHTNIVPGKKYIAKEFVIKSIKRNEWYAPAVFNLYNREFLLRNQLYYKDGYLYEDMEMLPRLYLAAHVVVYVDACFYNYVIRDNSIMTSEITPKKIKIRLAIYENWMRLLNEVKDKKYQRYLYGVLVRYYLATARRTNITSWKIDGMDWKFAFKHAIGLKDKLKVLLFSLFPKLYVKL